MNRLGAFVASHRAPVIVAGVVVGITVVVVAVIRAGTHTTTATPTTATPTTATPTNRAPTGPAAELVRLAERGRSVDLDVAYAGVDASSAPFTTHLWRRGTLARVDTETGSGDTATRSAQLVTSSGPLACTQSGSAPWSCVPKPDLRIVDIGVVSPALVARLSALDVSVSDDRIANEAVRCFTVAAPPASTAAPASPTAELCLASDGIPVRVAVGPTRLEAVSINRGRPPDSVFKAPA